MREGWLLLGSWTLASALACAGNAEPAVSPTPVVGSVVCPEGSSFDPARSLCIAGAPPPPPPVTPPDAGVAIRTPPPIVDAGATVTPIAVVDAGGAPTPPPLQAGAVNVSCAFPNGWVTVLPVGKYPKDDSFVMQALIGFTQDPRFWGSEPEYAPLKPYAAKRCTSAAVSFSVAPGDYWLLVGQEGTFSARGRYDKNGVKKKITVTAAGATYGVGASDLVQTWLCISCPWFRTYRDDGSVATSFVVLAHRSDREHEGTDRVALVHAPVVAGRIVARVLEREDEVTYLDELVLVVREPSGREVTLLPRLGGARSAVAAADGVAVELARGTEIALEYELPPSLRSASSIDGVVVATGHYELR